MIRKEFEAKFSKFYCQPVFWTNYYFIASCGGVTIEQLKSESAKSRLSSDTAKLGRQFIPALTLSVAEGYSVGLLAVEVKVISRKTSRWID